MKALILNSGMGTRMGSDKGKSHKCLTGLSHGQTILGRQLSQLRECGVTEVVMTTGYNSLAIERYCEENDFGVNITFVENPLYQSTNYIYSVYLARDFLGCEHISLHGDLVFEKKVLEMSIASQKSTMVISSTVPLPKNDFKAILDSDRIKAVGVNYFENCCAAQPMYHLAEKDARIWLARITEMCEAGDTGCYAENAFNDVSEQCRIFALDIGDMLCGEIDCPTDLEQILKRLR